MIPEFSRRGWVVPVIALAAGFAGLEAMEALAPAGAERGPTWPFALALALAGAAVLTLRRRWRRRHGLLVWDARRGKVTRLPAGHSFLWMDMQVWGWILFVFAVRGLFDV